MQQLKQHIRKNGFDYHKCLESEKGYVYSQVMDGKIIAWEVFKHKENTQFNCVSFPGNEAFGSWAWTYNNIDMAIEKFNSL